MDEKELQSAANLRAQAIESLNLTVELWKRYAAQEESLRNSYVREGLGVEKAYDDFSAGMKACAEQFVGALAVVDHWAGILQEIDARRGPVASVQQSRPLDRAGRGYIVCPDCRQTGKRNDDECNMCAGAGWIDDPSTGTAHG